MCPADITAKLMLIWWTDQRPRAQATEEGGHELIRFYTHTACVKSRHRSAFRIMPISFIRTDLCVMLFQISSSCKDIWGNSCLWVHYLYTLNYSWLHGGFGGEAHFEKWTQTMTKTWDVLCWYYETKDNRVYVQMLITCEFWVYIKFHKRREIKLPFLFLPRLHRSLKLGPLCGRTMSCFVHSPAWVRNRCYSGPWFYQQRKQLCLWQTETLCSALNQRLTERRLP